MAALPPTLARAYIPLLTRLGSGATSKPAVYLSNNVLAATSKVIDLARSPPVT